MEKRWLMTVCVAFGMALAPMAQAQDEDTSNTDDWAFGASIYGWFPDIKGRTRFSEGPGGGTIEVPISDILDNLETTFQGGFSARKGKWGGFVDLIYMNIANGKSASQLGSIGEVEIPVDVTGTVNLDVENLVVTAAGTYRVGDGQGKTLDVLLGVRYIDMTQTLDYRLDGNLGMLPLPGREGRLEVSGDALDFIVGLRGRFAWSEDGAWFTPLYVDIGTGDSDVTWQGMVGIGRSFGWGDVVLAYRHLDYDLPSDRPIDTLEISGPGIGAVFRF